MWSDLPYFCFFMCSHAALVTRKDPRRWTRWTISDKTNSTFAWQCSFQKFWCIQYALWFCTLSALACDLALYSACGQLHSDFYSSLFHFVITFIAAKAIPQSMSLVRAKLLSRKMPALFTTMSETRERHKKLTQSLRQDKKSWLWYRTGDQDVTKSLCTQILSK